MTTKHKDKLRADNGRYFTKSLFIEHCSTEKMKDRAIWSLRPDDHNGYPSIYKLYMASVDEYDFVMKTLGCMSHFRKLCELEWFMEGYTFPQGTKLSGLKQWREDMAMRDASISKAQLAEQAEDGNVTAMKILYDAATKPKTTTNKKEAKAKTAGRPTKGEAIKPTGASALFEEITKRSVQ